MNSTGRLRTLRSQLNLTTLSAIALLLLPLAASATRFQAEDYNAAYDRTPGNTGGAYRSGDVDIEATTDTGGGFNVGWIETGEWLAYNNLVIPRAGQYTVRMRVASAQGGAASVDLNAGSVVLANFTVPNTGGWQNWTTISNTVQINAGTYNLGVFAQTGGWNFNWIEVTAVQSGEVILYENCNYGGWSAALGPGSYNLTALQARGFRNDQASSLRVAAGFEAVLYEHDNYGGRSRVVGADTPCLEASFNDITSSVVVRAASRQLVWADEFNNIDSNNWTFETGGGGWGNNELQYYTNGQNASIQFDPAANSNVLVIEARRDNPGNYGCWYGRCTYTSTRMITRNKRSFQYGRVEARIKLPQTQGIWPAFWMLGNNLGTVGWPQSGEIDIMEHVGFEPNLTHGAIHGPGYSGNTPFMGTHDLGEVAGGRYHLYAVEWDTNGIRWFVDGRQFYSVSRAQVQARGQWVFDQPFFLLLNVAVGGTWPGSPDSGSFPQRMHVDYVRVYR